ncbi:MAG: type II toxin-antitoxin system RelE/ParE family toxin [Donghicola eburneus]|nr:type II toxin-antitoxin system RelE/ParE family toxin [Donghicola eburneus]MCI5039254.1 type II toxin-antitoxin system RelE/ParE family toxin [Donghicola eburneus]
MPIEVSRAAEGDLLGIFLYGIQEYGLAQAERYKGQLDKSFQAVADNPEITRLREEITPPVRVYPTQKHMIVYTILEDGQTVFVLRVRHHRENWTEHPIG